MTETTDAIKKLNTEILAGNGPDVILFDGILTDHFIEKNLLLDLSEIINKTSIEEGVIEGIANTYRKDNKLYAVPTRFSAMVVAGADQPSLYSKDLESLVGQMKQNAKDVPATNVFDSWSMDNAVSIFYRSYLSEKITDQGKLSSKDLESFYVSLDEVYRIWEKNTDSAHGQSRGDFLTKKSIKDINTVATSFNDSLRAYKIHLS